MGSNSESAFQFQANLLIFPSVRHRRVALRAETITFTVSKDASDCARQKLINSLEKISLHIDKMQLSSFYMLDHLLVYKDYQKRNKRTI